MSSHGKTWVVVLAAGEGSRLKRLTTTTSGVAIPKQFCSLQGGPSLLHDALRRAGAVTSRDFICAIVAAQHRRWWENTLQALPVANVIVQPENRGTANGILLPLLYIMERDPAARVVLLPSDHHVRDEAVLARALRQAVAQLSLCPDELLMLGMTPDEPDPELGYIVPGRRDPRGVVKVTRFVEKPTVEYARELIRDGALWNAFIIAATGRSLLGLFERRQPGIVTAMRGFVRDQVSSTAAMDAAELYERLPTLDFSRDIIEGQEGHLHVLPVASCGWSDLGTPKRVAEALRRVAVEDRTMDSARAAGAHLNLAAEHYRMKLTG
jgi:mannose-1-phosphate guanylyltransferase